MSTNKYAARLAALAAGTAIAAHEAAAQVMVVNVNLTTTDVANYIRISANTTAFAQGTTGVGSPAFDFKVSASIGATVTGTTSELGWIGFFPTASGFLGTATTLDPGTMVDASDSFIGAGLPLSFSSPPDTTFYLGYRYNPGFGANIFYGWAELSTINGTSSDITVVRYGFEQSPNVGIQVPAAIPEPAVTAGIFGVVAAALVGLRRIRRRWAA